MSNYYFDTTKLLPLLPPWYREILDYQQIMSSEQAQMDALAAEITAIADNFFFQTMDASAVEMWEKIFGIIPDDQTETIEFRRARLLNRISTRPPYTLSFLYQKLDELIGVGQWTVTVDYPNYTLYVESSAANQQYATEVAFTIGRIKPAHIVFRNTPYVSASVGMNETVARITRRYRYKLGTWQLGEYPFATIHGIQFNYKLGTWTLGTDPFAEITSEGVVKTPNQTSIKQKLLDESATDIAARVVKARINSSTVISTLTKTITANQAEIAYEVTPLMTNLITLAELLDTDNNVLTSSVIYVPVDAPTNMKHIIKTFEGVE